MKKVLHLNANSAGGAFVAANRLSEALNATGKIQSTHLVFNGEPGHGYKIWADGFIRQKWAALLHASEKLDFLRFEKNASMRFAFSHALTGIDITNVKEFREADYIHLHWINKGFLSMNGLQRIMQSGKQVFWTCHDMWPFTGGCYHNRGCDNYLKGCGNCQYLSKPSETDLSKRVFGKKREVWNEANLHFVLPSDWLRQKALNSPLSQGKKLSVIPNPIDTNMYVRRPEMPGRKAFGLREDSFVILFVAANLANPFKGFREFNELLEKLKSTGLNAEILVIGENKGDVSFSDAFPLHFTGYVRDAEMMAACYGCADVYVTTSLEENLPTTIMESLASGVPVAAFRVGGIPEMLNDSQTGWLSEVKDTDSLAHEIYSYYDMNKADREKYRQACVSFARENYDQLKVAEKYLAVYSAGTV